MWLRRKNEKKFFNENFWEGWQYILYRTKGGAPRLRASVDPVSAWFILWGGPSMINPGENAVLLQ